MKQIEQKINNRVVCILSHGKSIEALEYYIEDLEIYDICWASFNFYQLFEEFIFKKTNKKLEIVLDCADTDSILFENFIRIPSLKKIIERNDLVLSAKKLLNKWKNKHIDCLYKSKFILLEDYFAIDKVPNTLALLICAIAQGNPSKIILFGCDGYSKCDDGLESYYKPEFQKMRRLLIRGNLDATLDSETLNFNNNFLDYYKKIFDKKYNILTYNCSKNSLINIFPKIDYNDIKSVINEKN